MEGRQRGELAGILRSGGVLGRGSEEQAKGREEWLPRAFVVLMRATEGVLGLCPGLATAVARWRPTGGSGRRGTVGRHQREAMGGGGGAARRVGASATQNMAGQALHCAGDGTAQRWRGET